MDINLFTDSVIRNLAIAVLLLAIGEFLDLITSPRKPAKSGNFRVNFGSGNDVINQSNMSNYESELTGWDSFRLVIRIVRRVALAGFAVMFIWLWLGGRI